MTDFLDAHKASIAMAAAWTWARLRASMPKIGTKPFWRTWLYDFVKGNATEVKQPPA